MDDERKARDTVRKVRILQPLAIVFLSLFAGAVCPYLVRRSVVSVDATSWQASVLLSLRWYWTVPAGVGLAAILFWALGRIPPVAGVVVGFLISLVLAATAAALTWMLVSLP